MLRVTLCVFLLVGLNACAPVLLGRTPSPAPVGVLEVSAVLGYPFALTVLPGCDNRGLGYVICAADPLSSVGPGYWPGTSLYDVTLAYGVVPGTEVNLAGNLSLSPGIRLGGKTLLARGTLKVAADYGASLYLASNAALDLGVLASVPYGETEVYTALRGFASFPYGFPEGDTTLAGALTVGGAIPSGEEQHILLELTLLANGYNGVSPLDGVQPVGFSLIPAVGFRF